MGNTLIVLCILPLVFFSQFAPHASRRDNKNKIQRVIFYRVGLFRTTANCYYNCCSLYRINACNLTYTMTPLILKALHFLAFYGIMKYTDFILKFRRIREISLACVENCEIL